MAVENKAKCMASERPASTGDLDTLMHSLIDTTVKISSPNPQ